MRNKRILLQITLAILTIFALAATFSSAAQDVVPTETPAGPVAVTGFEPTQVLNSDSRSITVFGVNFASTSVVRLVGVGVLSTSFLNSTTLTAGLPSNLSPGLYQVQVVDPVRGTSTAAIGLQVFGPTATPFPLATFTIPTPQPGQPSLIVRAFRAQPEAIAPGGTVTLIFEIVNVGSRPAEGISISLGAEGGFTPAIGESSVTIPTINPGGTFEVSLTVVASATVEPGPASVPLVMAYRDFEGENYTSNANLSVTILNIEEASQVTVTGYSIVPDPVTPGTQAIVRVDVTNTGTVTVNSALIRVAGENSLLLPGERGDTLPLGDLAPGQTVTAELPMIVSAAAEPGPKGQPIVVSFFRDNEREESTGSITINVAAPTTALMLLQDYSTGEDVLEPGDRFTLSLTLQNVGDAIAANALLTFGTVSTSSDGDSGGGSGSGGSGGTGGSTTTTDGIPGNAFAPLGSGNTIFIGNINPNGSLSIDQPFIVNGTVRSGIYNLPITLRYRNPDGSQAQENLQASIVVVAPPRLQPTMLNPMPEMVNVGEGVPLTLEIRNNGTDIVELTRIVISAENAEIPEGAEQELSPVRADDDTSLDVVVIPLDAGAMSVTFTVYYMDDLNNERSFDLTFDSEAMIPEPPPEMTPFPGFPEDVPVEEAEEDLLARLLLSFLGLGG